MKIIQGKYKGTNLDGFNIQGTRPTMDRVKESLFAMIQDNIVNKKVLDLFAGSGSLGIEALSMGCEDCIFVDNNKISYQTISNNLKKIKEERQIIKMDFVLALKSFKEKYKFDIVFLDPPYKTNYIKESIELIMKYDLLNDDGIIICETDDITKLNYNVSLKEIKRRKYGQKTIVILKK